MGSDRGEEPADTLILISIHAPRMGSDCLQYDIRRRSIDFNPRSPDGERRSLGTASRCTLKFQSTLPGWGATRIHPSNTKILLISIHAPRMGSDHHVLCLRAIDSIISIHAPRMGSDSSLSSRVPVLWDFNPRSPDGERRFDKDANFCSILFQSTLPGWGATGRTIPVVSAVIHFNPRSPDGERLSHYPKGWTPVAFQSTLPGWGATSKRNHARRIV